MLTTTSLADERITTAHRAKLAYIYVRQSSPGQVRHHQESTELQYRLVERAVLLGGRLWVESTPGVGTRVTAELPVQTKDSEGMRDEG